MKTSYKRRMLLMGGIFAFCLIFMAGRLGYLMIGQADKYLALAKDLHQREREIKAPRGNIYDRNGVKIASNKAVYSISVIHSQTKQKEKVVSVLSKELQIDESEIKKKVYKNSVREKIKSNVDKDAADRIRKYELAGVKVDEDYKRTYPYNDLASKVLGFTGGDNQGIVGLEVTYDSYLQGKPGRILTLTDGGGREIDGAYEERDEPVAGNDLYTTLDVNLQNYVWQACEKVRKEKGAKRVSMIIMNPQNGEIYAMVNTPEYNLNEPFKLKGKKENTTGKKRQELLNQMWRNTCINDTYEPGSVFKIVTATAGLELGKVKVTDHFSCPGFRIVEDRKIRCHKVGGHGAETFVQGIQNSCNPVFIDIGLRLGTGRFCDYFEQFGLLGKTGVDLPGEAATIMHKEENIGQVELATMSFGQSFQVTPIQMAATVSALVNGGKRVTPHFGVRILDKDKETVRELKYDDGKQIVSEETSETMQMLLEGVVANGSGKNAYIEGYSIGGKTATSQTLPRSANKYISSFIGFAPADDPRILLKFQQLVFCISTYFL